MSKEEKIRFFEWYETDWRESLDYLDESGMLLPDEYKWLPEAVTLLYNHYKAEEE